MPEAQALLGEGNRPEYGGSGWTKQTHSALLCRLVEAHMSPREGQDLVEGDPDFSEIRGE